MGRIRPRSKVLESGCIELTLTKDQKTYIDPQFAELAQHAWAAKFNHRVGYYAFRTSTPGKQVMLHREIMALHLGRGLKRGELIDHIDRNTLNNSLGNLRLGNFSESNANRRFKAGSTGGYIGVMKTKRKTPFRASIRPPGGRAIYIGAYATAEEAAVARDGIALILQGEFAPLNFPYKGT